MLKTLPAFALALALNGSASAAPLPLDVATLVDICTSPTVSEAARKGGALGWRKLSGPEFDEWLASFLSFNGGPVDVIGWRRGAREGEGVLSFWIAEGPNAHRACAYSARGEAELLDGLTRHFGTPDSLDTNEFSTYAFWQRGAEEISYTGGGASVLVNITSKP